MIFYTNFSVMVATRAFAKSRACSRAESELGADSFHCLSNAAYAMTCAAEGVAVPCMLELLTVLPQEAQETKAAVHPDRRRQFRMEMEASVSDALHVLASCLSLTGDRLK